jgi:hypothetical protein
MRKIVDKNLYDVRPIAQAVERFSLRGFARASGVNSGTIKRALNLENITIATLRKFAGAIGVCPCHLLGCKHGRGAK